MSLGQTRAPFIQLAPELEILTLQKLINVPKDTSQLVAGGSRHSPTRSRNVSEVVQNLKN